MPSVNDNANVLEAESTIPPVNSHMMMLIRTSTVLYTCTVLLSEQT